MVDDIKLGQLVRRVGGGTRALIGGDDVECHWGVTVPSMIKIMEKNFFAALDFRIGRGLVPRPEHPLAGLHPRPVHRKHLGIFGGGLLETDHGPRRNSLPTASAALSWRGVHAICPRRALPRRPEFDRRQAAPEGIRWKDTILPAGNASGRERGFAKTVNSEGVSLPFRAASPGTGPAPNLSAIWARPALKESGARFGPTSEAWSTCEMLKDNF